MPHRNNKDMEELEKSLKVITKENNNNNIMIAGDFNYPDIQWETLLLNREAIDKEVQRTLIDITSVIFLIPPCLCCFYVACRMHQLLDLWSL
jgi:hypothetical protein